MMNSAPQFRRFGLRSGFTLVELLITVAIIGVLATVGIPTYRKMIQRARQAEAKQLLGSTYSLETAFFAEHGTYGNRLRYLGFEAMNPDSARYLVGQYVGPVPCNKPSGDIPPEVSPFGVKFLETIPAYYDPPFATATVSDYAAGRITFRRCIPGLPLFVSHVSQQFRMGAMGVVAPNRDMDDPGSDAFVDAWTMNEKRELSNFQSGIQ